MASRFGVTRWQAIAEAKKWLEISNAPWSKSMLAGAYARAGDREGALKLIEELKKATAQFQPVLDRSEQG